MIKTICFWLENSRIFSIPMSIFSWLVVFLFALTREGNLFFGILALVGIVMGQLATNLFDDYLDYKVLLKTGVLENAVKSKCRYITEGKATLNQVLSVVGIYCAIALIVGAILFYFTGYPVVMFAVLGGILVLMYSKMSLVGLSEVAVGLAFGPILFGGVYWVMTESYSLEVFVLSLAVVMFTIGLLYTHTLLDFDVDMKAHKTTLCCKIGDKNLATNLLIIFLGFGYLTIFVAFILKILPSIYFITYFTIPMALELFYSIKLFNENKSMLPNKQWWHVPMENMKKLKEEGVDSFMFRLYQARNLMIYFSLLVCLATVISILK